MFGCFSALRVRRRKRCWISSGITLVKSWVGRFFTLPPRGRTVRVSNGNISRLTSNPIHSEVVTDSVVTRHEPQWLHNDSSNGFVPALQEQNETFRDWEPGERPTAFKLLETPPTPVGAQLWTSNLSMPVDLNAPACRRLVSNAFSPHELVSLIEAIFTSKDEVKMIHDLRGETAQTLIDVVHGVHLYSFVSELRPDYTHSTTQALDLPDFPSQLRKKCLNALCWICGRQVLLPRSLQIPPCYNRSSNPRYRGGFADIWEGEHQGCHVAVKVLRVYSTSDFEKVTSVGSPRLSKSMS